MFHHDSRDYAEAKSHAAKRGREKMEAVIQRGQASAESVVNQILNACVTDRVVRATDVRLLPTDDGIRLTTGGYDGGNLIHPHAYGQIMADVGLPKLYVNSLAKEAGGQRGDADFWVDDLIAHNVNTVLAHRPKQRNLIRIDGVDGDRVKGFLSDKYRRLDSRPLVDTFMGICTECGLVPIEGVASDTKVRVRAVMPVVFEPIPDEVMIFGLEFGNSDYGDGGMVLNSWVQRVWCTNTAIAERGIRQIHLGGKLPDDLQLSQHTYELDALTTRSALKDVGGQLLNPSRINLMLEAIRQADEKEIKGRDGIDKLLRGLDKSEANAVAALYDGPDETNMPAGQTVYRLSNAVSFFAQAKTVGADRRIELQELAGKMMLPEQNPKSVREV